MNWTVASGESFYHVLETVESSFVEPEDGQARRTPENDDVSDTSNLLGTYLQHKTIPPVFVLQVRREKGVFAKTFLHFSQQLLGISKQKFCRHV